MARETAAKQAGHALRQKMVPAAAGLLEDKGLEVLSTRAVAPRTGGPAPSSLRLFGDEEGLLEEVAEHGYQRYLAAEAHLLVGDDPVQVLRDAWDLHVAFGLEHPAYDALVHGRLRSGHLPRAGRRAAADLRMTITGVAAAGRLRTSVERASEVMHSVGVGTIRTLIGLPPGERDPRTAETAREVLTDALTLPPGESASPRGPARQRDGPGGHFAEEALSPR
ncbi:TetR/AcrR family transcriptional regulator [Streptomyces olivaceoviridis]|uniref:TetR/AcrR family transcriptional regulator n=1 Tax=Streptomyces olivaceoviridis TaxID=1921 RepID=UPI0036FCB19F